MRTPKQDIRCIDERAKEISITQKTCNRSDHRFFVILTQLIQRKQGSHIDICL